MQPRVPDFHALVDEETAPAVEVWLSEPIMGTSREMLSGPEAVSFARRFTDAEADELWHVSGWCRAATVGSTRRRKSGSSRKTRERFDWLESRLLADTIQPVTGLQGSPNRYYQDDLPEPVTVGEFVASWSGEV